MRRVYLICSILCITLVAGCMHPVSPTESREQVEVTKTETIEPDSIASTPSQVCIGDDCFVVEIADTDEKRRV